MSYFRAHVPHGARVPVHPKLLRTEQFSADLTKFAPIFHLTDNLQEFLTELPPNEGMYVFYDVDYITPEGGQQTEKPSKLMFMIWAPDGAPMKEKMLYVKSRDPLYEQLGLITTEDGKDSIASNTNGIQYEVQATDLDEAGYDAIYKKVHRNKPRATVRHK